MVSDIKGMNSRPGVGVKQGAATAAPAGPRNDGNAAARAATDDKVELSGKAEAIRAFAHSLAGEPAVNEARVKEIRTAVESGEYEIDPRRIADKLIEADTQY